MAREEKRFELKPVDDVEEPEVPVIRLETDDIVLGEAPVRLGKPAEIKVSQRLVVPDRDDFKTRTHQPGIEALIETNAANPDLLEYDWGKHSTYHKAIPWGWFVLIALILGGAVIWSLTGVKKADVLANKIQVETRSVLGNDAQEELEAGQLIDRLDSITRKFFETTSVDGLARLVRHPERVRPLMERYYNGKPIPLKRVIRTNLFQPVTLDNRSDFWMVTVELSDHSTPNLVLEILDSGEPRIDWETLVCYQPMKWDSFASERPAGISLDFRVYLEPDNFFSHEFADSTRWNCYRLTALDSDETLFGYAAADSEVAKSIGSLVNQFQRRKVSMILRVNIPQGIQSRRGVVIEKLLCPRWLYVNPPEA
ncbi:MAG: hypothetical protein V4819_10380 [Verrucomicrobiota bacterium]